MAAEAAAAAAAAQAAQAAASAAAAAAAAQAAQAAASAAAAAAAAQAAQAAASAAAAAAAAQAAQAAASAAAAAASAAAAQATQARHGNGAAEDEKGNGNVEEEESTARAPDREVSAGRPAKQQALQGVGKPPESIFTMMSNLALKHNAIHLGQGFPNFDGPDYIKDAAIEAMRIVGNNQYTRACGITELNEAIAKLFFKDTGIRVDPDEDITVTNGCMEAMACAILGLLKPGDEVVIFEPFFFSHMAMLKMIRAKVNIVTMRPPHFEISRHELRAAFSDKTRALILSTPHNPTGKVFSREELQFIASLCLQHDVIVFSDEVYFKLVFEGEHICFATLDGMFQRTVTMNSMGKTFLMTGWRIGWTIAPPHLTGGIRYAHTNLTFSASTPLQFGAVAALEAPESYYTDLVRECRSRKDILIEGLRSIGFKVYEPQGTFFIMADHTPFGFKDDIEFCLYLVKHVGVAALPTCGCYENKEEGRHLVRFDFCKDEPTLRVALDRMRKHLKIKTKPECSSSLQ